MNVPRLVIFSAATALLALGAPGARAQQPPTEEAVEAAFLPKFARYVEWPQLAQPAQGAPFQLCVIGRNPFGRMIDAAAAGEQIDSHGVAVRHFASAESAGDCHIAFVSGATPAETQRLLAALGRQPVLTVTDSRAGQPHGMINFTITGARVRFFIDEAAAAERGLSISSRLLALATSVRQRR